MKTSTILALCLGASACSVGEPTTSTDQPLTFDEFRDRAIYDETVQRYIINGDEPVTEEELRSMYDSYLVSLEQLRDAEQGVGSTQENLTVKRVGNPPRDDRWANPRALTYCVSQIQFGANYQRVVDAMAGATADWEAIAGVDFTHLASADGNCGLGGVLQGQYTFPVEVSYDYQLLARAFFPSDPWYSKNLVVNVGVIDSQTKISMRGVLRHELGHVLGFRHEHTRPEAGTCFEDNNWRPLTAYDSASVMHYPQCNGSNKGDLVFTALDQAGARALYP